MTIQPASPIQIAACDLNHPQVIALLATHRASSLDVPPGIEALSDYIARCARPEITIWGAWDSAGRLLGVGGLSELSSKEGEVRYMHTREADRGRGVAKALLEHIVSVACSRGYSDIWVETGTREAFVPALALYRSFGFSACSPFGEYVADPRSAFLRLPRVAAA